MQTRYKICTFSSCLIYWLEKRTISTRFWNFIFQRFCYRHLLNIIQLLQFIITTMIYNPPSLAAMRAKLQKLNLYCWDSCIILKHCIKYDQLLQFIITFCDVLSIIPCIIKYSPTKQNKGLGSWGYSKCIIFKYPVWSVLF